jgi:hypothetical protein
MLENTDFFLFIWFHILLRFFIFFGLQWKQNGHKSHIQSKVKRCISQKSDNRFDNRQAQDT